MVIAKIYIISGKAKHGKTTSANYIKEYYTSMGESGVVTSFAKYIKLYAYELGVYKNEETKPREFLQTLGTEIIKEKLGLKNLAIDRLDEDIQVYNYFTNAIIIDDARIPEEIEHFKNKYGSLVTSIHIERPNFDSQLDEKESSHITEKALDNYKNYDYTIINDGTLEDLKSKIFRLIERIR